MTRLGAQVLDDRDNVLFGPWAEHLLRMAGLRILGEYHGQGEPGYIVATDDAELVGEVERDGVAWRPASPWSHVLCFSEDPGSDVPLTADEWAERESADSTPEARGFEPYDEPLDPSGMDGFTPADFDEDGEVIVWSDPPEAY